jgi:chromosome segregation ATPase
MSQTKSRIDAAIDALSAAVPYGHLHVADGGAGLLLAAVDEIKQLTAEVERLRRDIRAAEAEKLSMASREAEARAEVSAVRESLARAVDDRDGATASAVEWRDRALDAEAEVERLSRALQNVLMLARRMERRCDSPDTAETAETAHHIIRLCTDAGVHPEILRAAPATEEGDEG